MDRSSLKLQLLPVPLTVCQLYDVKDIPSSAEYTFTAVTDEEVSLVCPTALIPHKVIQREDGWRAFRIMGILDFSLIGILADIADILAEKQISIFAVSSFNTDYVLVKEAQLPCATDALTCAGYQWIP